MSYSRLPQSVVYKFILLQIIVSILLALFVWLVADFRASYSVATAGLICVISNSFFTSRVFRHRGARAAKHFLFAFLSGEILKLVLLGCLFIIAVSYLHILIGPFLLGLFVNLFIFWLAPFIHFGLIERK